MTIQLAILLTLSGVPDFTPSCMTNKYMMYYCSIPNDVLIFMNSYICA